MIKKPLTEKSIMLGIISALSFKGWRVIRMPPAIYAQKGIPDLYAIKQGISVWIEVKSQTGKLSVHQRRFAELISYAGGSVIVARSVDYAIKMAEEELSGWKRLGTPIAQDNRSGGV